MPLGGCRYKNVAIRDRHAPRTTAYQPKTDKKSGGGKANWGRSEDFYDDEEYPLNQPFEDPRAEQPEDEFDDEEVTVSL